MRASGSDLAFKMAQKTNARNAMGLAVSVSIR